MIDWIKKNKSSIIRVMFIIPILLVAAISISHVVSWYDLANPISWAIYLSIAIEIAAMTALSAASVKVKGFSVWFVFGVVTFIQFMGNIFFSYKEIDLNDSNFKSWVELVTPIFDMMGLDSSDPLSHKRWLALLTGGLLPLISLTCLHFFIKYGGADDKQSIIESKKPDDESINTDRIWEKVTELKEEGKLPPDPTNEDLIDEPTALANSSYNEKEQDYTAEEIIPQNEELGSENFTENGEEKKNDSTESINIGGSTNQGTTNNSKIQMGSSKSGENIIYKQRGLRQ